MQLGGRLRWFPGLPNDSRDGADAPVWLPPDRKGGDRGPLRPADSRSWARRSADDLGEGLTDAEFRKSLHDAQISQFRGRLWLHVALFLATVASTTFIVSPRFSACLMAILTAHEFGHYFAARVHLVPASLPYFIPAPVLFGTMGAFIRMSPFVPNRRALFDIAAAGPIAGVVLAIPVSFAGMLISERVPLAEDHAGIMLGDPLLLQLFERILFGPGQDGTVLMLSDVGFAGWVGLFVTGLNLLPVGQLDGGHVAYAVFGARSVLIARLTFLTLAVICALYGLQYLIFLILLFFMGLRHPPTLDDEMPLGRTRGRLALALAVLFLLCFIPVPIAGF